SDQPDPCRAVAGLLRPQRRAAGAGKAGGVGEEIDSSGLSGVPGGRQALQVAAATPADPVQHDAGTISRQMGPAAGLSHGRAELRRGALATGKEDGARSAAAGTEVARQVRLFGHCEERSDAAIQSCGRGPGLLTWGLRMSRRLSALCSIVRQLFVPTMEL